MIDDNIGLMGGLALGQSLAHGGNLSLVILKLDYNHTLGTKGIANLCKGLRSNSTLRELHVQYCQIHGAEGGTAVSDLLANSRTNLTILYMQLT